METAFTSQIYLFIQVGIFFTRAMIDRYETLLFVAAYKNSMIPQVFFDYFLFDDEEREKKKLCSDAE